MHDEYHFLLGPTRGRPSAGPWGNRWQTRRLNSLKKKALRQTGGSARIAEDNGGVEANAVSATAHALITKQGV